MSRRQKSPAQKTCHHEEARPTNRKDIDLSHDPIGSLNWQCIRGYYQEAYDFQELIVPYASVDPDFENLIKERGRK